MERRSKWCDPRRVINVTAPKSTLAASHPDQRCPDMAASASLLAQKVSPTDVTAVVDVVSCFFSSAYFSCHMFIEMQKYFLKSRHYKEDF
jgi:hypothetical protein